MQNNIAKMYSKTPAYIIGFHGCSKKVYTDTLFNNKPMVQSSNKYDWLGNGIYFWENSYQRAVEWATSRYGENGEVIGAFIDLGYCLDLTDYNNIPILQKGYNMLRELCSNANIPMPQNTYGYLKTDLLVRNLDCAVIQQVHEYNKMTGNRSFDSVRGTFDEGSEVYPGSGFKEKTHTQVSIINPNCIKGFFIPREIDSLYDLP
jgi:hypothetical protein